MHDIAQLVAAFEVTFEQLNKRGCSRKNTKWRREFPMAIGQLRAASTAFLQSYFLTLSRLNPKNINFDCCFRGEVFIVSVEGDSEQPPEDVKTFADFTTWRAGQVGFAETNADPGKFSVKDFTFTFTSKSPC